MAFKIPHAELTSAWRPIVMEKNGGKCVCGCGRQAEDAHHINTKGSTSWVAKYDPRNGAPMYHQCHLQYHAENTPAIAAAIDAFLVSQGINPDELAFELRQVHKKNHYELEVVTEKLALIPFN